MHVGVANCINSVGNTATFKTKLTKLFIYKLVAKESIAVTFSFAGFEGISKDSQFYRVKKGKAEMVSDWQAFC